MADLSVSLLGELELVTPASGQAVTTAEAEDWLRQERGLDSPTIAALLERATVFCEQEVPGHRQIRAAVYDLPVCEWWEELYLPRPPLLSVSSVSYYDTAGDLQTVDGADYLVRTPWRQPGTVCRGPGVLWPTYQSDRRWPIKIRFRAGYEQGNVPATLRQAILFVTAQWYHQRSPLGQLTAESANTLQALLLSDGWGSYA